MSPQVMRHVLDARAYDVKTYACNWAFRGSLLRELEEMSADMRSVSHELVSFVSVRSAVLRQLCEAGERSAQARGEYLNAARETSAHLLRVLAV